MTTSVNRTLTHTVRATADLSGAKFKLVTLAGTIAQATSGLACAGLLETAVGSGYNCGVVAQGIVKAYAGAAVASLGWPATLANSGWITNAASGNYTVGRFLETCNSGDLVQVMLDVTNVGATIIS